MNTDRTSQVFFEDMYQKSDDPWRFASSEYELDRYSSIIAALDRKRYGRALEPGCSIGVLTAQLARICDRVEAFDISQTAVDKAQARCSESANVVIEYGSLPDCVPHGPFDLVVLSEVGYYFETQMLLHIVQRILREIPASGTLLAAHWLGSSPDHVLSGDTVHSLIATSPELVSEYSERHAEFRLDRWRRL